MTKRDRFSENFRSETVSAASRNLENEGACRTVAFLMFSKLFADGLSG